VQLIAGLMNEVCDAELDRRSARPGKPIASGQVPAGNATFIATALFLLAVPLSLQSGVRAGLILLATLLVAFLHNRSLHRTPASFLGWVVTVPMIAAFVSYADRDIDVAGTAPPTMTLIAFGFAGLCLHLITSLRDLPYDHKAGIKPLPLLIALRTGAPKLMYATIVLSIAAGVVLIIAALGPGLIR
jgi:4-hydroxybenzoate polyprenyltransferase